MMKKYKVAIVIGRFQPTHHAHMKLFEKGLEIAEKLVIVLGSTRSPRTIKNPWTYDERKTMIEYSFPEHVRHRVSFLGAQDYMYSDAEWLTEVTKSIREEAERVTGDGEPTIALVAHNKDESSYYINYFKFLDIVYLETISSGDLSSPALSSTKIRELYFEGYLSFIDHVCPAGVLRFLKDFQNSEHFQNLKQEYDDAVHYQKMFETAPYNNTNFLTVDSVVIQSGHVLLIQRGKSPGKNLWALPGGHLNNSEKFIDGAIRELLEETQIKVPEKVLRGSIFTQQIFDHPDRSMRCRVKGKYGRTVTMAFGIKLDDSEKLPRVRGSDDANAARWIPLDKVVNEMRENLFEDHWDIIKFMVARLK